MFFFGSFSVQPGDLSDSASTSSSQAKASDQSHVSLGAENKGSGESSSPDMSIQQERQSGVSKDSSSDKKERIS